MPDSHLYRQLPDYPFVFVSDEDVTAAPVITDSLFDAVSRGIRFKVNRTELLPDDPFIMLYSNQLVPWLKAHDMQLRQVFVKGAASPEGSYQNNVRLSRERTRRLIDFLSRDLGQSVTGQPVDAKSVTEDYGYLVNLLKQAGDQDYQRVNDIWLSCKGDEACCKRKLMALDRGKVWDRLKEEYFPALRQARMILWFARKREKVAPKPVRQEALSLMKFDGVPVSAVPLTRLEGSVDTTFIEKPVEYARRHLVAARTNLLHDLLYVPQFGFAPGINIQLEYYPLHGHYTLNAGYTHITHRHWGEYKFFQIRDLQLELRRYFRGGGVFIGPYMALYAEGTKYGIGFSKTKGWEGEGGGGGLSAGYVWPLNRKGNLRLEVSASLGFFYTRHDPYIYGNPLTGNEDGLYYYDYHGNSSQFRERNHEFTWLGPTNAGIHLTYDILYRKKHKL